MIQIADSKLSGYCFPILSLTPERRDSLHEEFDALTGDVVEIEKCSVKIVYKDIYGSTVKKDDTIWANIGASGSVYI